MNTEALRQLKRVVRETPIDKIDMRQFRNHCGTVRCIAGWAESDPWFQNRGLDIRTKKPFGALAVFFDIPQQAASNLFGAKLEPDDRLDITKDDILDKIDSVMRGRVPKPWKRVNR